MTDIYLYVAGGLTVLISIVHGYLGAIKVVPSLTTPHASVLRLMHALFFLSAVYWFAAGVVMILAPQMLSGDVRQWAVYACAVMLFLGGLGNIWAMRGKHFGGYALLVIVALAIAGA